MRKFPSQPLTTPEQVKAYFAGDHIHCLICGKKLLSLFWHLRRKHEMTADDYREQFGLPWDRGLIGQLTRERFTEALARQPKRPVPDPRGHRTTRPIQPFMRINSLRSLEVAIQKRPNTKEAHERLLRCIEQGETIRVITARPDMPSLNGHYAYRAKHKTYNQRVEKALKASRRGNIGLRA